MDLAAALVVFAVLATVQGQYDSLERKSKDAMRLRIQQLRDYLIDRGMYQEAVFHLLSYAVPSDSDNALCSNHSSMYQVAVLEDQPWAQRMLDASSKLGDGVLQGNFVGLGSYDECLEVSEPHQLFTGQLCLIQTKGMVPPVVHNPETNEYSLLYGLPVDLTLGVCLPSTCTPRDVAEHWQEVAAEFNASAVVEPFDCSVKGDIKPGKNTWVAVGVLVTLFALVVGSSWYDWTLNHKPAKNRKLLVCFSAFTSWQRLTGHGGRASSLDVVDGIRVLAISSIVLAHRFQQSLQVPNLSLVNLERFTTAWFMSPIYNIMLIVDLFLLLSGCLLSFQFFRARDRGEKFNLVHFYYKRYLRLTPALALVMMLEGCILLYVSDGPLWKRMIGNRVSSCTQNWWTGLLYISNYANPYKMCLLHTWYLSVDMQLYLFSPLLLIPMSLYRGDEKKSVCPINKGLVLLCICYGGTTVAAFLNAFYLKLPAGSNVTVNKKTEYNHSAEYIVTHVRAASWLTGVALGYVLHRVKKDGIKINYSRGTLALYWVTCVTLFLAALISITPFQSPDYQYDRVVDSLHIALHRNFFSIGAAGIIFLCVTSKRGPIQAVLGWRGFKPLATLSYGVYLFHMGFQTIGLARIREPLSFDMFTLWTGFFSDILVANLAAVLIFFLIESPLWELGQLLYKPGNDKKPNKISNLQNDFINTEQEKTTL